MDEPRRAVHIELHLFCFHVLRDEDATGWRIRQGRRTRPEPHSRAP